MRLSMPKTYRKTCQQRKLVPVPIPFWFFACTPLAVLFFNFLFEPLPSPPFFFFHPTRLQKQIPRPVSPAALTPMQYSTAQCKCLRKRSIVTLGIHKITEMFDKEQYLSFIEIAALTRSIVHILLCVAITR